MLDSPHSSCSGEPTPGASFWKYNDQQKGPRATKFQLNISSPESPGAVGAFADPVFDETQAVKDIVRHSGKARRGEGNDTTPNPEKLYEIGCQLTSLTQQMSTLEGESAHVKREKNVLSSRYV